MDVAAQQPLGLCTLVEVCLVVAADQEQLLLFIGWILPTCSTCTGEDMFTAHYRDLRESLLDHCSNLVHKPVPLLFGLSHCSCVIRSPARRLLTFLHIAHFSTEHPSTSQSAEAAADASSNAPTTPKTTNGHHMSQLRK